MKCYYRLGISDTDFKIGHVHPEGILAAGCKNGVVQNLDVQLLQRPKETLQLDLTISYNKYETEPGTSSFPPRNPHGSNTQNADSLLTPPNRIRLDNMPLPILINMRPLIKHTRHIRIRPMLDINPLPSMHPLHLLPELTLRLPLLDP